MLLKSRINMTTETKVAVVGATGRVGREVVKLLASRGISVKCLVRFDPPTGSSSRTSLNTDATSYEVAEYFSSLEKVEMIKGHVGDVQSLKLLLKGCTACFALFGSTRFSKISDLWSRAEDNDPAHAKSVNYVGVQNILQAAKESKTCKRIVRITGKGESPWSIFSILLNTLGSMGKGWNYEGEQLLRNNTVVDYTIIRPGRLVDTLENRNKVLALKDNGGDLKVSSVARSDIALLCVECLNFPNTARSTLVAMNVAAGEGEDTYLPLLAKVKPDTRDFPQTLIAEHKRAVRSTMVALAAVSVSMAVAMFSITKSFLK